ncbi:site-2 protease family protein [Candidatus Woesearchaeota archaeon]|nr:site-2 protease family protein [Candidatus Woesearchaeota archaeon]
MFNFEIVLAMVFVLFLSAFLYHKRDKLHIQKIVFPLIFMILYKSKFGISLMDKIATKYREWVKLFGYISAGVGFIGMFFVTYSVIQLMIKLITAPATTPSGVVPVLPFTNIPGLGYLSFTTWLIAIFILAVVHEFSHGVVARAHNLEVKSSGFAFLSVLLPIIPAAFVEPDEKKMAKKEDIVQYSILAAGPVSNVVLALLILFVSSFVLVPLEGKILQDNGFTFEVSNETLPAYQSGLRTGDVILAVNNKPVTDYQYFMEQMQYCSVPNEPITLATAETEFTVVPIAHPDDHGKGYIGVNNIKKHVKIKDEYEQVWWTPLVLWLKDLFKWLFWLNLFIGLANLLPLGIVDGGQMLKIMLLKLIKNKHHAMKLWSFVAIGILVILLFALIINYTGNPFSLLK